MFQDELPDYYYFSLERLEREAKQKLLEEEAEESQGYDPGVMTALCQGQDMPIPYHHNAIDKDEAERVERRRRGVTNKGRRALHDLRNAIPDPSVEAFWTKR